MDNVISTDRLLLTPLNENVLNFITELEQRRESYKHDADVAPAAEKIAERCRWFIERARLLPAEGAIRWIINKNNSPIGEVHLTCNWETTHEWEIGYKLMKEYWGNGFACEAVKAVIKYAFANFDVNRIAAFINAENIKSAALAERAGMTKDGRLREVRFVKGTYNDEYVFSILKREFKQ